MIVSAVTLSWTLLDVCPKVKRYLGILNYSKPICMFFCKEINLRLWAAVTEALAEIITSKPRLRCCQCLPCPYHQRHTAHMYRWECFFGAKRILIWKPTGPYYLIAGSGSIAKSMVSQTLVLFWPWLAPLRLGIEPRSPTWQAGILTTILTEPYIIWFDDRLVWAGKSQVHVYIMICSTNHMSVCQQSVYSGNTSG